MTKDWQAVADAIDGRIRELGMSQLELIQRSGIAPMTLREIHKNLAQRRRSPRTLAAISEALEWPSNYLLEVSNGRQPSLISDEGSDPVLRSLDQIHAELKEVQTRLAGIEKRISAEDGDT